MSKLPLLCKGYFSNQDGSNSTLSAIAATTSWQQQLDKTHGDLVAIDVMKTGGNSVYPIGLGLSHILSVKVGGMAVIDDAVLMMYEPISTPRSYEITKLRQPGGQTLNFQLKLTDPNYTGGAIVHAYFTNEFANQNVVAARRSSALKQRVLDIWGPFASGVKAQEFAFTLPRNMGNIVAMELLAESEADDTGLETGLMTVAIDGSNVFESVSAQLGMANCGRPDLIFPIAFPGGVNGKISADTSASVAGTVLRLGVRFYFDDSKGNVGVPENYCACK